MSKTAASEANRPSDFSWASNTRHSLAMSLPFRLYVFVFFICKKLSLVANPHQAEALRRRGVIRCARPGLLHQRPKPLEAQLALADLHQRADGAAHLLIEEGVGLHIEVQEPPFAAPLRPGYPSHRRAVLGRGAAKRREVVLACEASHRCAHALQVQR